MHNQGLDWITVTTRNACLKESENALIYFSDGLSARSRAYFAALNRQSWQQHHPNVLTNALVANGRVSGWHLDPRDSKYARARFEAMVEPFFPDIETDGNRNRTCALNNLSNLAATFAALANTRSVCVTLTAQFDHSNDNDHALDFSVAPDATLRGEVNLIGSSRLFANRNTYDLHTLESVIADSLDGDAADDLEKNAISLPEGSLAVWSGLGDPYPVITAEPRCPATEENFAKDFFKLKRLTVAFTSLGEDTAHRQTPQCVEKVKDRFSSTRHLTFISTHLTFI